MSVITQSRPPDPAPHHKRFTLAEFVRAAEHGSFDNPERLELIDGEVFERMTQHTPHYVSLRRCEELLKVAFGKDHDIRTQAPIDLPPWSQPEPDIAVVRGSYLDYLDSHPKEALLIVEVSDSSLRFDQKRKASVYAKNGILDYWIVNLVDRVLEVYRDPSTEPNENEEFTYQTRLLLDATGVVSPLAAPDANIAVADLLP